MTDSMQTPHPQEIDLNDARPRRWGWWLLIFGFGGFLLWAVTAPLDAGVSAAGTVVVSGYRKSVQPLVAGKIVAILAKDGDEVSAGQVLVRLDDTQSRSQLDIAMGQWLTILATKARLEAERSASEKLTFPAELRDTVADPRAAAAVTLQRQLFATRRSALRSELNAMEENLRGIALRVQGLEASSQAKREQLQLLHAQLVSLRSMADEEFLPRNRVLEQERTIASLVGALAEDQGNIGQGQQSIAEVKMRIATRQQEARREVESLLADTQRDESALHSRLDALQFDLRNTEIRSPSNGMVMGLTVHTVGGVVAVGSPMMEVVPKDEILKIDAQIPPHLIDKVKPGLTVDILFTALNQSSTPRIAGRVDSVSADVMFDAKQNQPYFKALVEVTPEGMRALGMHPIRAGMQAEIFVRTGERTAMNYLVKPLLDRVHSALTEP